MKNTPAPWWGKIGLLWLLVVPVCTAIYVLAQPLAPNDFWYHLRAGAWMINHGEFPRVALFTPSVPPETPYFYQSWLSEIAMYLTFKWSGLSGSAILRTLLFTGSIAIFIAAAQHRTKVLLAPRTNDAFNQGARRVTLVAIIGLIMCVPNMDLRPQSFSLPFFAVFAAMIFTWSGARKSALIFRSVCCIILMAIWANTHGAFVTGLILLLLFCLAETAYYCWGKCLAPWLGATLNSSQLKFAWLAALGSFAAACANPMGIGIYRYVYELANNVIGKKYIQEWQPPTWNDGVDSLFFYCLIAICIILTLLFVRFQEQRKNDASEIDGTKSTFGAIGIRPGELLLLAAFVVMALRNVRSIIWFALLFIIVFTALVCRAFPPPPAKVLSPIPKSMQWCNAILAISMLAFIVPFLPRYKPLLPWPSSYLERFAPTPQVTSPDWFKNEPPLLLARNTPTGAAAFLRQSPPRGLLWNNMVFGSYLVWALYPVQGPWTDPRIELRTTAFWEKYIDTSQGKGNPEVTLAKRGFSDVLVDKNSLVEKKLKLALQNSSRWKVAYEDETSLLFRTPRFIPQPK